MSIFNSMFGLKKSKKIYIVVGYMTRPAHTCPEPEIFGIYTSELEALIRCGNLMLDLDAFVCWVKEAVI